MSASALASKALDLQLDFINHWKTDEGKDEIMEFVIAMIRNNNMEIPPADVVDRDALRAAGPNAGPEPPGTNTAEKFAVLQSLRWWDEMKKNLPVTPTYVLTEEMMELTEHAGETIASLSVTEADLPSDRGFLYLPRPLLTIDKHDRVMSARVILWWKSTVRASMPDVTLNAPSLQLMIFSDKADWEHDYYFKAIRAEHPDVYERMPKYTIAHLVPVLFHQGWGQGEDGTMIQIQRTEGINIPEYRSNWMAFLKTFFLLVQQKITIEQRVRADRGAMRRRERAGVPPEYGEIQLITLRHARPRKESEVTGDSEGWVDWSHRWLVGGHWRDQYYPSCPLCSEHHVACRKHPQLLIQTYEKGPLEKPLVIKDRVFVWRR